MQWIIDGGADRSEVPRAQKKNTTIGKKQQQQQQQQQQTGGKPMSHEKKTTRKKQCCREAKCGISYYECNVTRQRSRGVWNLGDPVPRFNHRTTGVVGKKRDP